MDENKGIPSALVRVPAKEQQEYVVQMAFELPDVEKESKLTVHFDDTQGYSFHIYASSIMEAIDRGLASSYGYESRTDNWLSSYFRGN